MVAAKDVIGKVWLVLSSFIPNCCSELFEGKSYDLVIQVQFISTEKNDRLHSDSSDADSKKSYSRVDMLCLGKCVKILGRPTWMSPLVDLGIFGCICGDVLRKLPNYLMRCVG
jgi:hypothetical protein